VNLADAQLGDLVRLDQVYDLVEGNIGSEVRAKISRHRQGAEPSARAAGGEGDLPAPVREERPPQRREHRGGAARQRAATRSWPR
jgi:hypothetical protein